MSPSNTKELPRGSRSNQVVSQSGMHLKKLSFSGAMLTAKRKHVEPPSNPNRRSIGNLFKRSSNLSAWPFIHKCQSSVALATHEHASRTARRTKRQSRSAPIKIACRGLPFRALVSGGRITRPVECDGSKNSRGVRRIGVDGPPRPRERRASAHQVTTEKRQSGVILGPCHFSCAFRSRGHRARPLGANFGPPPLRA